MTALLVLAISPLWITIFLLGGWTSIVCTLIGCLGGIAFVGRCERRPLPAPYPVMLLALLGLLAAFLGALVR